MNSVWISLKISGLYTNDIDDQTINLINDELYNIHGISDIEQVLKKHDLRLFGSRGKSYSIGFKLLGVPVRNAYLWFEDGKGSIKKRSNPLLMDQKMKSMIEKKLGPYTPEYED